MQLKTLFVPGRLILLGIGLLLMPAGRAQSPVGLPPVTTGAACSFEKAAGELLGIDEINGRTNVSQPVCALFVVDVSGSMGVRASDGRSRLRRVLSRLPDLIRSGGLSHPQTRIGILRAGSGDPGDDYGREPDYLARFVLRDRLDWKALAGRLALESPTDRGSNLRAAHLRGLRALERFTVREQLRDPSLLYRRYLVMLSDGFLEEPQTGPADRASRIYHALQDADSPEYRLWRKLILTPVAETIMVEPYNFGWLDEPPMSACVFPTDLVRLTPGLREGDVAPAGRAVIEGTCGRGTGEVRLRGRGGELSREEEPTVPAVRVECRIHEGSNLVDTLEQPSDMAGRFFFVVNWSVGREMTPRRAGIAVSKVGFAPAATSGLTGVRPGDHLVFEAALRPSVDWRPVVLLPLGAALLVLLFWPWDLRLNGRDGPVLHLLRPVQLYDPQSDRPVGTIVHVFCNWLVAAPNVMVRVNGTRAPRFRRLPGRCQVAVVTIRTLTFLVDSGWMTPGRLLRRRRERLRGPV